MSAFPRHEPPPASSEPPPPATGPDPPPWALPQPDFHHPQPPHFAGYPTFYHPQRFSTPPAYRSTPPGGPPDFPAMNDPMPAFGWLESSHPPLFAEPEYHEYANSGPFGAPMFPPAQDDGPRDQSLASGHSMSQYSMPPFIPHPPWPGYVDDFSSMPTAPRARNRPDLYVPRNDDARRPFYHRRVSGAAEATTRESDQSPSIANGTQREQLRASRPYPYAAPWDAGEAGPPAGRRPALAFGRRPGSNSPGSRPQSAWDVGDETLFVPSRASPEGLRGPARDARDHARERLMQRAREQARRRHDSDETAPVSGSYDLDPSRAYARRTAYDRRNPAAMGRHYEAPTISEAQIAKFKAGLKKMTQIELPKETSPTCDICDKDYSKEEVTPCEEAEVAVELPCKHVFGEDCLNTWFKTCKTQKQKATCPMCRKVLIEPPSRRARDLISLAARYGDYAEFSDAINRLSETESGLSAGALQHLRSALIARGRDSAQAGLVDLSNANVIRESNVRSVGNNEAT